MTSQEFKAIATEKFNTISTNDLIAESKKLMFDISDASDLVLEVITDILFEECLNQNLSNTQNHFN